MAGWLLVWALAVAPALSCAHALSHPFDAQTGEDCALCWIAGQATGAALPVGEIGIAVDGVTTLVPHVPLALPHCCQPDRSARDPPAHLS
ncbi:MAG: hypothetical protein U9R74_00620 [Pseudomonadota bacterium]|nr:hypothetical protein [Pseudomonadota bacterium]